MGLQIRSYVREDAGDLDDLLFPDDWEAQPLTTSVLRSLQFASLIDDEREETAHWYEQDFLNTNIGWKLRPQDREIVEELKARWERRGRTGKGGRPPMYGPEHFAKVAAIYAAVWRRGERSPGPTQAVADECDVSRSAAAKWVARAREMGLLAPTTRGRAGATVPEQKTKRKTTTRQPTRRRRKR